jgi:predicted deacylase
VKGRVNKPFTIGSVTVAPGSRQSVDLPIVDLYTATALHMPVHVVCGKRPGPVAFISAAVHGDEINGVEIVRRLLALKVLRSLRGTLVAVPVVNVPGFLERSRYLPDRRDLNRSFPGSAKGSIAARLANIFMREVVGQADFGIDLHTGAIDRSNLPQVRVSADDDEAVRLAHLFGAPVVIGAGLRDGSLRACAFDKGIPMLVYEAGEALRFEETAIRGGVRGVLRVLRDQGMLPKRRNPMAGKTVMATSTQWVRAPSSGIVIRRARLGSRVKKGEQLASITDPLGEHADSVTSPLGGIIVGCSNLPLAHEGDALFHIASFDSVAQAAGAVEEFVTTHDPALGRSVESELIGT